MFEISTNTYQLDTSPAQSSVNLDKQNAVWLIQNG